VSDRPQRAFGAPDAVTWSTRPPVNRTPGVQKEKPDYPLHPNAVWYVYVGDKNNVTEIRRWGPARPEV